mmetsp:Transcript_5384/g.8277  ORF Transcript_5384/g.8277 Transcript_5384/m.8277 type:complete len:116 (-) Transcript_5384:695-1042(-)
MINNLANASSPVGVGTLVKSDTHVALMPPVLDEAVQIACAIFPLISLLWYLCRRGRPRLQPSVAPTSEPGIRTADIEQAPRLMYNGSKGSIAQREADRREEELIKKRAASKLNGH